MSGAFRVNRPPDFVALVVSSSETKWPTATPLMLYLHVFNTVRYKNPRGCSPNDECPRSIGGTFMEHLAAGDKVEVVQHGKTSRFVYSGEGGSALNFRGELIAESHLPPVVQGYY